MSLAMLARIVLARIDIFPVGAAPSLVAIALGESAAAVRLHGMDPALRRGAILQRHLIGAGRVRLVAARTVLAGHLVVGDGAVLGLSGRGGTRQNERGGCRRDQRSAMHGLLSPDWLVRWSGRGFNGANAASFRRGLVGFAELAIARDLSGASDCTQCCGLCTGPWCASGSCSAPPALPLRAAGACRRPTPFPRRWQWRRIHVA